MVVPCRCSSLIPSIKDGWQNDSPLSFSSNGGGAVWAPSLVAAESVCPDVSHSNAPIQVGPGSVRPSEVLVDTMCWTFLCLMRMQSTTHCVWQPTPTAGHRRARMRGTPHPGQWGKPDAPTMMAVKFMNDG